MKGYILLFIFFISIGSSIGQGDNTHLIRQIDSLKKELRNSLSDSSKAEALRRISSNYLHINPDSSIYYGEKAIEGFQRTKNFRKEVFAEGHLGEAYIKKGNLPKALEMALNTISIVEELDIRESGIGPTYDNLGLIYYNLKDYERALYYYKKMIHRRDVDIGGVAFGYFGMASVYEKKNDLDSAIFCLDKSRDSYHEWNNLDNSIDVNRELVYQYEVYPAWYNLRAQVYLKQNMPELALADLRTTLKITMESKEIFHTANTYNDISAWYKTMNQWDSSIFYAEKGIAEASKISNIEGILAASTILAELYESLDPARSLQYFKLASETEKKLYGSGNVQVMKDMITQNEKKQQELAIATTAFQNRLRMNALLGSTFTLVVIAIMLFRNSRNRKRAKQKIEVAYKKLQLTQSQLIQSEKMASLGELTAGIAHEIQNPLNFVNNFSEVSLDLIEELKGERDNRNDGIEKMTGKVKDIKSKENVGNKSKESTGEIGEDGEDAALEEEILNDIYNNLEKIHFHGNRASSIVKGMLQHSRAEVKEKAPTDINVLADEFLRLAYHGLRAKDKSFTADYILEAEKDLPEINVISQDIERVLLNLFNNAFYAVSSKASATEDSGYKPKVSVSTKTVKQDSGSDAVEIRVKDNGYGIPPSLKEKIFQPFFTTKPTGEGTGLGLSISYDIITKGHNGEMRVESNVLSDENIKKNIESGTEFIITIPN